jgi:hypothetical protein
MRVQQRKPVLTEILAAAAATALLFATTVAGAPGVPRIPGVPAMERQRELRHGKSTLDRLLVVRCGVAKRSRRT